MTKIFDKDSSINTLIEKLHSAFGNDIQFLDHWDADLCAIGISSERKKDYLVYVLTYQQPEGKYYINVDKADNATTIGYRTVEEHESIGFDTLEEIIVKHLEIQKAS